MAYSILHSCSLRCAILWTALAPIAALALVCTLLGAVWMCNMAFNATRCDDADGLGLNNKLVKGRIQAKLDDGFAVFMIGIGINNWYKLPQALRVLFTLHALIRELKAKPETGYLGGMRYMGNPAIIVQYWKSAQHIKRFAYSPAMKHMPAWTDLNASYAAAAAQGKNFGVGVWHEIYQVKAGQYENLYRDMPLVGLARCGKTQKLKPDATPPKAPRLACPLGF